MMYAFCFVDSIRLLASHRCVATMPKKFAFYHFVHFVIFTLLNKHLFCLLRSR